MSLRALLALVAMALLCVACSGGDDGDSSEAGSGAGSAGSAGTSAAGSAGDEAGSSGVSAAGSSGTSAGTNAGTDGGAAGTGIDDAGANDSGGGGTLTGVCGERGEGTVSETELEGFLELFVIGDEGFGDDVCVVRFDIARVDEEAPEGCDDPVAEVDCLWTHVIELSNPEIVLDIDDACANSPHAIDDAKLAELDGSRVTYGFVSMFAGHNSVLLKYDEAMEDWVEHGNATYDENTGDFGYDRRDGFCEY